MKLHLNKTLRAALVAAITAVGLTLTQAQAADITVLTTTFNVSGTGTDQWTLSGQAGTGYNLTTSGASLITIGGEALGNKNSGGVGTAQLNPNVNVQNPGPGWKLTFTVTNNGSEDVTIDSMTINSFLFSGGGSYQSAQTTRSFVLTMGPDGGTKEEAVTITGSGNNHPETGVIKWDFADAVTLASQGGSQTFSVQFAKGTEGLGCFVGLTSVVLNQHVAVTSSTWKGSEGNNNWTTSTEAWDPAFVDGNEVVFGTEASCKTVVLSAAVQTSKVTVEDNYTIDIQTGGSMSVGTDGIVIAQDKTLSLMNETGSTYNLPTVSGEGNIALSEGTFTLSAAPTTAKLLVNGGTLELGDASYTLPTFEISNGGVVTTTRNNGTACVTGDIHILAGGTFKVIGGHDAFGYNGGQTDNIYMTGESGKIAKLELNQNTGNSVTMQTNLHMGGYSSIVSKDGTKGFNTFGCSISAQGEQNTIQLMDLRNNVTIDVAASGSLDIAKVTKNGDGDKVITKTGEGTLSFTGDSLMNGLNVNKGTVAFTGGTSTVDALSLASDGTLSVSGSGTVVNIGGASNTISSTVQVDAATLNLTGTFAIDGIPSDMQTTWSGAADAGNGFKTSTGEIKVYTATNGGTVTIADSGHITYGGTDVKGSLNNGVYSVHGETDYSNFYVNTDGTTELVTKAYSDSHSPDKFTLAANTGLTVDQSVSATVSGAGASSIVSIDSNKVLTGTAQNVALAGAGTYALNGGSQTLGTGVTFGGGWEGTVRLSGSINNIKFDASVLGNHVEACGISGYFYDLTTDGHGTYTGTLTLTNPEVGTPALLINNGFSRDNAYYELSGAVDGSGTWRFDKGGATVTNRIIFSGNTADWDGALEITKGFSVELTFAQSNGEMGAAITRNGGTLNMIVGTAAGQSTVFNQEVTASTLTVNAGATATFEGDATFNSLSGTGKVALGEGTTLTVSGTVASDVTIDAKDGTTIDAELAPTQVGIAADATATFVQGISDADVEFYGEDGVGVQVKNTNEAGGDALRYDITKENAKVMADGLVGTSESAVTVKNEVVVKEILNYGGSPLTLTHVDTETLQSIGAYAEGVTLQNVGADPIVLKDITLIGTTVAVYQGGEEIAAQEGTVIIKDTLFAGGGTLLANLEMADGSTLNVNGGGAMALTLGSEFTIADGSLVTLDDATLAAIAGLENIGDKVILIKQYGDHALTTNLTDGDWARTHFDLSSIAGADYQLYVGETEIGLMKSSNVPEPTTGTLSLLALMALAARRRRK